MDKHILSIDPGDIHSAYAVLDGALRPVGFGKIDNNELNNKLCDIVNQYKIKRVAIEHISNMGARVGKTIFTTCIWVGRFTETLSRHVDIIEIKEIYRYQEKSNLCHNPKAKDKDISKALRDRFGEKGTQKNKGWFYGVSKDVWAAIAVGVTYHDLYLKDK